MATKALPPFPISYKDAVYSDIDAKTSARLGLPVGMLEAIRTAGEKSNADQVSSAGARTPYQITPETRNAILKQYGIDAYLSPETASEAAGILLRDSLKRGGNDPERAVREYHGGTDPKNWGKVNQAYWERVSAGMQDAALKALSADFGKWMADNPAQPAASPAPAQAATPDMASAFQAWLKGGDQIPGAPTPADRQPPALGLPQQPAPQAPGIVDKAIGTGEAALSALTGATGGALGMVGGMLGGLAGAIATGVDREQRGVPQLDPQKANRMLEDEVTRGMQSLTYAPRTQSGQDQAAVLGEVMQNLIPIAGAAPGLAMPAGAVPAAMQGLKVPAAAVLDKAATAMPAAVRNLPTLPRRALAAAGIGEPAPTPGTMGSVGSAGADMAAQRVATAESLPVPLRLTKGEATRDPAQMKFEEGAAKNMEAGADIRARIQEHNANLLGNFDTVIDQTGAEAPNLRVTGMVVDKALRNQYNIDKGKVNAAYKKARESEEASLPVDTQKPVTIGQGEKALTSTPFDWINQQPAGLPNTALLDAARQDAVKLGIADLRDGQLVPKTTGRFDSLTNTTTGGVVRPTVGQMESWREAINARTGYEPTDIRQATILKALIDGQTGPLAGPLFKEARGLRTRLAQNYEDIGVIAKLLNNKRGTADRQVALEDVFAHSILKGSLDDVRQVRRVLHRSGPQGMQAWRELQGQTAAWLRDQATTTATDGAGTRIVSPAKLDKLIKDLDADGKLEFIFGKKGAQTLRDLRDVAQWVKTAPPEAAVNYSNSAWTLLGAFGDVATMGTFGAPVPAVTIGRMAFKYVKDAKLRRRIEEALNDAQRKAPNNKPGDPIQAPGPQSIH